MIQRMGRVLRRKRDGRSARFVLVYVKDTGEDPAQGAHEAFVDDLVDVAEDVKAFSVQDARQFVTYLAP
jgi:hypothetical protein